MPKNIIMCEIYLHQRGCESNNQRIVQTEDTLDFGDYNGSKGIYNGYVQGGGK